MRQFQILNLLALSALMSCKTIVYKVPSEQINLNLVKMITAAEAAKELQSEDPEDGAKIQLSGDPWVNVEYSENNKPFIRLELFFKDSGLNIIEEIKKGTIVEHRIVVKNHKGETISAQPVNFQAYEVTETKIEKVRNKVVIGETQEKFKLSDLGKESKSYKESEPRRYSDDSPVPQALELDPKKVPNAGEYVNIYLEITYVNPFLEGICDVENADCEKDKTIIFKNIAERNRIELESLRGSYEEGNFQKFKTMTPEEVSLEKKIIKDKIYALNQSLNTSLPKESTQVKYNRSFPYMSFAPVTFKEVTVDGSTEKTLQGTVSSAYVDQTHNYDGNKYFYREWNLVSTPRFFKVQSVLKNGKSVAEESVKEEKKQLQTLPKEETEKKKEAQTEQPENVFDSPNSAKHKKRTIYTP